MTHTTPPTPAAPATKYFVKCDECRETMRFTDSMQESAKGGRCEKCRAEITAKMAKAAARKQRGATKAQLAYRAKLFAPIAPASPSIHDDIARLRASVG